MIKQKGPDLPPELAKVRAAAQRALGPIAPATAGTKAEKDFLFKAKPTEAGRRLPPQHLVYFTLADLLGFKNLGAFEKIAWSIPIDFRGQAFLIEHRKFGLDLFAHAPETEEPDAASIVRHIQKAVKAARPYFDWLAGRAVEASAVNVVNNSRSLFDRFDFFLTAYREKAKEALDRKDEHIVKTLGTAANSWQSITFPAVRLGVEAQWLGLAAVDAFFSWTEHVFIHLGILSGTVGTAKDVADLAEADWATKYKRAVDLTEAASKDFYDKLLIVRQELRNFVAHGAFGKQGEAFSFHSTAGAVPVLLPHRAGNRRFTVGSRMDFDVAGALGIIKAFLPHLWNGPRAPAEIYIQHYELPLILTLASDGSYRSAMASMEEMEQLAARLANMSDQAANMDW